MTAFEQVRKRFNSLDETNKKFYERIMEGRFLPIEPFVLENEESIVWNMRNDPYPFDYLMETTIQVPAIDLETELYGAAAYAVLKPDAGEKGLVVQRVWLHPADVDGDSFFKVRIDSISAGKESVLWKKENE
ncbi:MAG TPA: hypothetical protein VMX17_12750 [Candidatus Glassbacteria bacterium]|nr:hypothetical protein [Candidatus Glassbacteria bacterium]